MRIVTKEETEALRKALAKHLRERRSLIVSKELSVEEFTREMEERLATLTDVEALRAAAREFLLPILVDVAHYYATGEALFKGTMNPRAWWLREE
jgi:uncharacterized protein (UPF0276 family)